MSKGVEAHTTFNSRKLGKNMQKMKVTIDNNFKVHHVDTGNDCFKIEIHNDGTVWFGIDTNLDSTSFTLDKNDLKFLLKTLKRAMAIRKMKARKCYEN